MNFISHSHAYSLYPQATFKEKQSLVCCSNEGLERDCARQKYVDRDWNLVNGDGTPWHPTFSKEEVPPALAAPVESLLAPFYIDKDRYVGDCFTWKISLPPIPNSDAPYLRHPFAYSCGYPILPPLLVYEQLSGLFMIEANSWKIRQVVASCGSVAMMYEVFERPSLRHTYVISVSLMEEISLAPRDILFRNISVESMESFYRRKGENCDDFEEYMYVFILC